MDPNLFHIDWERLGEVLIAIIVLSFLIERALAMLFESRFFIKRFKEKSLKEIVAVSIGALVCWYWDFDALSMIFLKDSVTIFGTIITGAIIAGGSKASIKLFKDVMGVKSMAQENEDNIKRQSK
jgi:hypothetical protein